MEADPNVVELSGVAVPITTHRPGRLAAEAAAIDAHWTAATAGNPSYFDGAIVMLCAWQIDNGCFVGEAFPARFREYLYWRSLGRPDWGFRHLFGAGAIVLGDGRLVMVRAAGGTINAGHLHLPGGFVDQSDVRSDGRSVDIAGQIIREIGEELGVSPTMVQTSDRWLVVSFANEIGIVRLMRPALSDAKFCEAVTAYVSAQGDQAAENASVEFIDAAAGPIVMPVAAYCEPVLEWFAANAV